MTSSRNTVASPAPSPIPDVESYLRVHRALRASARSFANGFDRTADPAAWTARARWYAGFAGEIRCHHHIEDELLFPALRERVPTYAGVAGRLDADHAELDDVLDGLSNAVRDEDADRSLELAGGLADHLDDHLDFEDAEIAPLFVRHFTKAEFDELNAQAIKMTPPRQLRFTVPWLMASLTPDEQAVVLAEAPKAMRLVWIATRRRYRRTAAAALSTSA